MLSTRDLEELELAFRNINSIHMIKVAIITFISIYIVYTLFI